MTVGIHPTEQNFYMSYKMQYTYSFVMFMVIAILKKEYSDSGVTSVVTALHESMK